MKIEDLDVLRPEPRIIRLNGKEIDVSFIPCAITFTIQGLVDKLNKVIQSGDVNTDQKLARDAFDIAVDACAAFCEHKYPEMDREWFLENTSPVQVGVFMNAIREALVAAYNTGSAGDSKNERRPRKK